MMNMIDGKTGKFIVNFGTFDVPSRNKKFNIDLHKTELINEGYIDEAYHSSLRVFCIATASPSKANLPTKTEKSYLSRIQGD